MIKVFKNILVSFLILLLFMPVQAKSATIIENTVAGSIGGLNLLNITGDSNHVTLSRDMLKLRKEVRDLNGVLLSPAGGGGTCQVAQASFVWFVVYLNNITNALLEDIRMVDAVSLTSFTVQEIAPNVHAQVLDIAPPAPPIAGGAESAAITTNWAGAWLDITDADGDNGHQPDAGMYDSATQTFTFGTDTANMDLKSKNFRAYRLKVLIN